MTLLNSCCRCCTLRTGSLVSGVAGIVLAVIGLIAMFTTNIHFRSILLPLPQWIEKIILAINLAMTILISILLIIGVVKRKMLLMYPWVILGILVAIALLVSTIYTAVVFYIDDDNFNGTIWLIGGIIAVLIYTYMWAVVFSFFQIVKEETERGAYQKAPFRRHY